MNPPKQTKNLFCLGVIYLSLSNSWLGKMQDTCFILHMQEDLVCSFLLQSWLGQTCETCFILLRQVFYLLILVSCSCIDPGENLGQARHMEPDFILLRQVSYLLILALCWQKSSNVNWNPALCRRKSWLGKKDIVCLFLLKAGKISTQSCLRLVKILKC